MPGAATDLGTLYSISYQLNKPSLGKSVAYGKQSWKIPISTENIYHSGYDMISFLKHMFVGLNKDPTKQKTILFTI